jgi:hypothetical protein
MIRVLKSVTVLLVLLSAGEALARGGAASIMDSPGYQRRLQESRGYVTNQSGSIIAAPPAPVRHGSKRHHHHQKAGPAQ